MSTYLDDLKPVTLTPVATHQGGTAHQITPFDRLRRFLILGSAGGSYYVKQRDLTSENLDTVRHCLDTDPGEVIKLVVDISYEGRAPSNDPALLVLALASVHPNTVTRLLAFDALPSVARIGTHLLHFAAFRKALGGGEGRAWRKAMTNWFAMRSAREMAYHATKYASRDGWAMTDLLRMAHGKLDGDHFRVQRYLEGWGNPFHITASMDNDALGAYLTAIEMLKNPTLGIGEVCRLIEDHRLPREVIPTTYLNEAKVWASLLKAMPMTAMIRNLGKMSNVGLIHGKNDAALLVANRLHDTQAIRTSRVHPLALLVALKVYQRGRGDKGSLTWTPSKAVVNALDEAFYLAFGNVPSAGVRLCLGIDTSASMTWSTIAGTGLTPREASAAMALVTAATEPDALIYQFSDEAIPLRITPTMRLDEAIRVVERDGLGENTNPNALFTTARREGVKIDCFVSYTDNETGSRRAAWKALEEYRAATGVKARHVAVGMIANQFSLANPDDPRQLDIVGFDAATPEVISLFAQGRA